MYRWFSLEYEMDNNDFIYEVLFNLSDFNN